MEEDVNIKIKSMYDTLMEKPLEVYQIFKDFYGEELVDMQGYPTLEQYDDRVKEDFTEVEILSCNREVPLSHGLIDNIFILVRFPEVKVTNENNKSITIWELYAKVLLTWQGKSIGSFSLNRSEYDMFQLKNSYLHSHMSSIPTSDFTKFMSPCLGEGPIRGTLASLAINYDPLIWQLFCLELSKYVQVESLGGGPYKRLEQLGNNNLTPVTKWSMRNKAEFPTFPQFHGESVKNFVRWVISRNKLKFDYTNGSYGIAMPYTSWQVFISNEFIEWYNIEYAEKRTRYTYNDLIRAGVVYKGVINNNKIYQENINEIAPDFSSYIGKKVCTFKGEEIRLSIRDYNDNSSELNKSTFINMYIAEHILSSILQVINYEYGNNRTDIQGIRNNKEVYYV